MEGDKSISQAPDIRPLPSPLIAAKVSRCFDEMVAIVSVGVDLDDPTTNVRDVAP